MARRGWGGGGRAGGFWDAVPSPRGSTVETPAAGFSERATEHQHFCSVLRRGRTPPLESRFLARIGTAFASPAPPGPAPAVHDARDLRARAGARGARGAPARPRGAPAPPLGRSPAPPPRPRPPRPDRPRAPGPPPRPRRADASARGERRPRPDFDVGGRAGRGGRGPVPRRRGESAGRPRDLVSGRRVGRRRRVVGRRAAGGGGCRASNSRRTGTSPPPPTRSRRLSLPRRRRRRRGTLGTLPVSPRLGRLGASRRGGLGDAVSPRRRLKRRRRHGDGARRVRAPVGALRDANRARVPPLVGPFRPRVPENPLRGRFGRRRGASGPRRG